MTEQLGEIRLLGQLLERGFVRGQPEVIATRAVGVLLEDGDVAERFTQWLHECFGVELPDGIVYRSESGVATGGRVDIAGSTAGSLQVAFEAKFGAHLGEAQLLTYARALDGPLLAVLVPSYRRHEAAGVLAQVESSLAGLDVSGVVVTWDELMDGLDAAGAPSCDVEQLRSLCAAAGALEFGHLSAESLSSGRDAHLDQLHTICDRVTRRLHLELVGGRVLPLQKPDGDFSGFRYVCPERGPYCFAIGVRSWPTAPDAPIWMRWHRETGAPGASEVHRRLRAAGVSARRQHGHVWVPLDLQPDTDILTTIDQLANRARQLDTIARDLTRSREVLPSV